MIKAWYGMSLASLLLYGFWGYWGTLTSAEVGAKSANFYTALGAMMVGLLCVAMMEFKPVVTMRGVTFGLLTGATTGLGTLFFLAALRQGPAIPIVMITALYPVVSTLLLVFFFDQSLSLKQGIGIIFSIIALILLS